MSISLISSDSALASSLTLPTHDAGDVILISARRIGSATPASLPAGWTNVNTAVFGTTTIRMGYLIAASSGESSGTWTNASIVMAAVYRGASGVGGNATASGTDAAAANVPAVTLTVGDGTSWVHTGISYLSAPAANNASITGMTPILYGVVGTPRGEIQDTNGGVSSWSSAGFANGSGIDWACVAVELVAAAATGNPWYAYAQQ